MIAESWTIPVAAKGRLAVLARPRGGDWLADEVSAWRKTGVQVVVSLLEPAEAGELGLADERTVCERAGLEFVAHPVPDRGVPPDRVQFNALVADLARRVAGGGSVGIHCRAGIGRSGLAAAGVLVALGLPAAGAFAAVGAARGRAVPDTAEQAVWLAGLVTGGSR